MPADFDKCVRDGGKVRTVSGPRKDQGIAAGEYVHYCIDKSGTTHRGEVRKKETMNTSRYNK